MNVQVSFKNMDSSDALREVAVDKISSLNNFLSSSATVHYTFRAYDRKKVGDIRIHDSGNDFFAKAHSEDFFKTLDLLQDKVRAQVVKQKDKRAS